MRGTGFTYCRVPAGRGLRKAALAPGHDETRSSDYITVGSFLNDNTVPQFS